MRNRCMQTHSYYTNPISVIVVGDEFLVFSQGSTIQRTSLPPRQETVGTLFGIPGSKTGLIIALDYDYANKYTYFTDVAGKALWRVRFNGTGAEKIITTGLLSPEGIKHIYIKLYIHLCTVVA